MMEWSKMLPEVLDIIAQKYITCYEDYPSFAGVCKSWRLAASRTYRNSNGPPSRFPSLMLLEKSDDRESCELFLLSNKSIRKIRLPEAYGKACNTSCGWLLTVGEDLASQLINPLSREIINLPKVDTFPDAIHCVRWREYDISNVVLVMESKLVVVIWGSLHQLGFCHTGDNKWTCVEQPSHNYIFDITFYSGHIYSFDSAGTIQACNVNGKDPRVLVEVAMIPEDVYDQHLFSAFIVGLDDGERKHLLVIILETKSIQVLSYDLESGNWSKVTDFGAKTLFVRHTSSFSVEDTTGVIKGNCVYYIDCIRRDMGIYHMLDGTIEPHVVGESVSRVAPPIWLQSM